MLLLLSACAGSKHFRVTGKVALEKKPQPNIELLAFKSQTMLDFKKPDFTGKTDESGNYSMTFPGEGEYYITAKTDKKDAKGVELFAFYGRNPLFVPKVGVTNINLNLQKVTSDIKFAKAEQSEIKCVLTHNGEPLSGVTVYVAVDLNEGMQTKGFVQSDLSDEKGETIIPVDKGTYYLTARKRMKGMFGPMKAGDLIGFFHKNPLVVSEKGIYTINMELVEIPKKKKDDTPEEAKTIISGTVQNEDGKPVKGIWVCAYKDQQMFGKPLLISEKTDATGKYKLYLPKGDKYYVAARNTLGGPPNPGDLHGNYSGSDDNSVSLKTGEKIDKIDITIMEMW